MRAREGRLPRRPAPFPACWGTWAPVILDRFLQTAEIIEITGKRYRLKDRIAKK